MAPTAVSMVGRRHEEVIEVHEDEEVTLECMVENAKPVAEITWYKNDREIRLGKLDFTTKHMVKGISDM